MANPTCTVASVLTNFPCFTVLNEKQQLAFIIWYAANELKAIGGTDYTNDLTGSDAGSLLTGEAAYLQIVQDGYVEFAPTPIMVAIFYNNAINAGATVSSVVNTTVQRVKYLCNPSGATMPQMKRMLYALLCQLGSHKSYPQ